MLKKISSNPALLMSGMIIFICGGLCLFGIVYLNSISHHPTAEAIFLSYLSYSGNTKLFQNTTNVQGEELSMGQGVYLRFETKSELVMEFLEQDRANPHSYHHPYKSISCQEFYEAYPDWADRWNGYEWWRPKEVESPECYVTRGCEYLLFDKESKMVYYYFFPDFLGRDYLCVEDTSLNK